jgi:hypothetical protein
VLKRTVLRNILRAYLPAFMKSPYRTGGTDSARYCYSVWLRHLSLISAAGLPARFASVTELGPGDSLGTGMAALLGGAERYAALDVLPLAERHHNLAILDELANLFRDRSPIPDEREFPRIRPLIESYGFPDLILPESILERSLSPDRVGRIRHALAAPGSEPSVSYIVPWSGDSLPPASQDLIYSQAVLQSVTSIHDAYAAMLRWLRPGGLISHTINFHSFGSASRWNGHWAYSDAAWRLICGFAGHAVNREPMSRHLEEIEGCGFEIITILRTTRQDGFPRDRLAARFRRLPDEDLVTSTLYVLARKR